MRVTARYVPCLVAAACLACDATSLVAPTQSTLSLVAADTILPAGGSTLVTALVVELAGTPVHDGTVVTFTSTLGAVHPAEASTVRGSASALFTAGQASGVADLRAYSGSAVSDIVQVTVGAAAVGAVHLTALPGSLPPAGGEATLVALVLDVHQNPIPHVRVAFGASAGTLRQHSATTDDTGEARTVLRTTATAEVTASAGGAEAAATVTVEAPTAIALTPTPSTPIAGQPVSFALTLVNETRAIRSVSIAFGDGQTRALGAVTAATVTHTYGSAGAYTVTVTATDIAGFVVSSSIVVEVVRAPGIPVTLAVDPADPVAGQPVTVTVTVTPPPGAPAVRDVVVEFGDGSADASLGAVSGSRTVAHVYASQGSYTVTVTVTDDLSRRSAASQGVTVAEAPAVQVTLAAAPAEPVAGQAVTITVTVTPPAGAPAVRDVVLNFGDDSEDASLGAVSGSRTVSHVYATQGSYIVTATVTDDLGRRSTASQGVTVAEAPAVQVTLAAAPAEPVAGQAVTITVTVTPPPGAPAVRDVVVEFGDGSADASLGAVSGSRTVPHVYPTRGSYIVTATVTDDLGRRSTASQGVTVAEAPAVQVTLAAAPAEPVAGQAVTITVTVTPPAGAPAVRDVVLDFGDDSEDASLGAVSGSRTVSHVYATRGSYIVTATVTDDLGRRSTASQGVTVAEAPAVQVTLAAAPAEPVAGQAVTITVTVTPPAGAPAVRDVVLDFGDDSEDASLGAVSGSRTVAHVYDSQGSYIVTATVTDGTGRQSEASIGLTVAAASTSM